MDNYRFAKHDISDTVLGYAAGKDISASKLRNTKYGYNYDNMLSILEMRAETGKAKYDDLSVAVKLHDNIRKMSKDKRAKVDYDALKSRAQKVYTTLADSLASPEPIQIRSTAREVLQEQNYRRAGNALTHALKFIGSIAACGAAIAIVYAIATRNTSPYVPPASVQASVETNPKPAKLEQPTAPKPAAYIGKGLPQPFEMVKGMIDAQKTLEDVQKQIAAAKPAPEANPFLQIPAEPPKAAPAPEARKTGPSPAAPGPMTQDGVTVAQKKAQAEADRQRKVAELEKQKREQEAAQAKANAAPEFAPVPAYSRVSQISFAQADAAAQSPAPSQSYVPHKTLAPPTDGGNITVKGALRGEGYFDPDTTGGAGTGKLILDAGSWGVNAYGNTFITHQKYDDYNVDGDGARFWGGAYVYLPVGKQLQLFLEGDGGAEQRNYTIKFDSGNFKFGNKSPFVTAKLGLTDGLLGDPDNFGVGDDQSFILLQGTKHFGSATGDAKEQFGSDYSAFRFSADGRLMLDKIWSIEAGASTLDEKIAADFMKQKNWAAEAGMRWHAPDHAGYVELLGVYQDFNTTVAGDKSDERKVGPKVGAGWRIVSGDTVTLDATIDASYLFNKDKNEWQVMPGFTLWFGGKKAK